MKHISLDEVLGKETAEIETCFANGAWKATYLLTGCALERVLVTYFACRAATGQAHASMQLGDVIAACRNDRRLLKYEAEIAEMLRVFRNMVRPDISARIERGVTRSAAAHAIAVLQKVSRVIAEQATQPRQPQTAEKIALLAVEPDIDEARLHELLLAADPKEMERLLLKVVPEHTYALLSRADPVFADVLVRLRIFFDLAFCFADEAIKHAVVKAFMAGLEERDAKACVMNTALFRPKYLQYFDGAARKRMLRHLLVGLQNEMSLPALNLVDGSEEFLCDDDDLLVWLQAVVIACLAAPAETAGAIREYAKRAYGTLSPQQKQIISEKQETVFRDCEREGNYVLGRLLRSLQDEWAMPSVNSAKAVVA